MGLLLSQCQYISCGTWRYTTGIIITCTYTCTSNYTIRNYSMYVALQVHCVIKYKSHDTILYSNHK